MAIEDLLDLARKHIEDTHTNEHFPAYLSADIVIPELPQSTTVEAVLQLFGPTQDKLSIHLHQKILVTEACLRNLARTRLSSSNPVTANLLKQAIMDAILPTRLWAERQPFSQDEHVAASPSDLVRLRSMNVAGLHLLSHLERISPSSDDKTMLCLLTCAASFADSREAWSCLEGSNLANSLLSNTLEQSEAEPKKLQAWITVMLQEQIKPQFAKSKNPAITQQGRKAINPAPSSYLIGDSEGEVKPWKFDNVYVVAVFRWILEILTAASIEAHWPLLIPPLLALIDDATTHFKVRGCELLTLFLNTVPSPLLQRTGLGEVFQNALMPCLLHLPSLTTESESSAILEGAYPALITLIRVLFPGDKYRAQRMKAFDKVMRDGVFKGYAHAGENARIAELLIKKMTDLINELEVDSAKYLKHIIPLLSQILSAPFATAYPPLIEVALQALEVLIISIWPRVAYHRAEILEGLAICWCRIQEEETQSKDLQRIQAKIQKSVNLVTSILKVTMNVAEEYQILIETDSRLQNLLLVP